MKRIFAFATVVAGSALLLAGCGDPAKDIAEAKPAAGSQMAAFSRESTHAIKLSRDGALLQRYCLNMTGAACPADILTRLGQYGFKDGGTGIDLGYAFTAMAADAKDGTSDQASSDEDYIAAIYRVMFARVPDPEGGAHHLGRIAGKGIEARKALVLDFLKSAEFTSQK